ncbi:radical SAM additional 4Fe4S-binding SPASM domain-containing protein [Caloranaerobacter azorensis DSM 13643]|uniref:Radical SAM additional 4Fe4S-binding SPASM domain-containing protein n=1 Tax=Caloranaerobacter azorensis DSM 13643 TaxID=1121264 RepID=A0A1M5WAR1_9FIRM|nr:radical SAM protein [Caloranaerobacter azorensis]SHH84585.1 radical SAM additional 4Fe4S-binding SPASM domain-containing protein [Caloranaerobacter azorensis DSM 13643]
MNVNSRDVLVLKNNYKVKVKNGRCVLETIYPYERNILTLSLIHGIIFSMLDGNRCYEVLCDDISYVLGIPKEKTNELMKNFIDVFESFIEVNSGLKRSDLNSIDIARNTTVADYKTIKKDILDNLKREPVSLVYFVTQKCGSDCIYCAVGSSYKKNSLCDDNQLNIEEIQQLAFEARKLGFSEVELTGGDPLMHPDILRIIEIFSDVGIKVNISTKMPITETFINKIKNINNLNIQISLDAIDPVLFERLTGTSKDRLKDIITSLELLSKNNIDYKVKATITSYNIFHIPSMVKFLHEKGCKCFHVQSYYMSQVKHNENLFPKKEDYKTFDLKMQQLMNEYKDMDFILGYDLDIINGSRKFRSVSRPYCLGGRKGMAIYENGDFGMCGMTANKSMRIGNIRNMTLKEAWESENMMKMIKPTRDLFKGTLCEQCDLFDECSLKRCYLRSLIYFGTIYEIDPLCPYSKYDYKYTRN